MLISFAETHIGRRKVNEDYFLIDDELGLYIVADGVGGLQKGEEASKLACTEVHRYIISGHSLIQSIELAHKTIVSNINLNSEKQGMATTIVAVLFNGNSYEIAWVGDSRVYLWDTGLKLLTKDDSYVELLLEGGHIQIEDLGTHPDRNIISQALGVVRKNIIINTNNGSLKNNQILLICTDGLYNIADEKIIYKEIKQNNDIETLTKNLVQIAIDKEGKDNITLVSVKSSINSQINKNILKPNIVREYNPLTGKMEQEHYKNLSSLDNKNNKPNSSNNKTKETNQTELKELSKNDREQISSAAKKVIDTNKPNHYLHPIMLIIVLVIATLLVLR